MDSGLSRSPITVATCSVLAAPFDHRAIGTTQQGWHTPCATVESFHEACANPSEVVGADVHGGVRQRNAAAGGGVFARGRKILQRTCAVVAESLEGRWTQGQGSARPKRNQQAPP